MNLFGRSGRTRGFVALLVLAAGLGAATPALAGGGSTGDLEVGVFAGMIEPDDYAPLGPDGGSLVGFRLGYAITDAWSVEGSYQV